MSHYKNELILRKADQVNLGMYYECGCDYTPHKDDYHDRVSNFQFK